MLQRARQLSGVAARHDRAAAVGDEVAHAARIGRHHRQPAGHRLEDDVRRVVEVRRQREHISGAVELRRLGLRYVAGERDGVRHFERDGAMAQRVGFRSVADDQQVRAGDALAHDRHRVEQQREVLERHQPRDREDHALVGEPQRLAHAAAFRVEQLGVHTFRHALDVEAEEPGQLRGRPAVGHQRVGAAEILGVAGVRLAGQVDDDRHIAEPQPRRLIQGVRVHDVGTARPLGDAPPRQPAEDLLVEVQRVHRQTTEAAAMLKAVDEVARVRRAHARLGNLGIQRVARTAGERPSGDDVDLDAERAELARPGEVPRLAAAAHHREAADQHRHAHARSSERARSTCALAHSSRQTSAQMRFA